MQTFYLGLGSNLGDRRSLLRDAMARLTAMADAWRGALLYETAPVDYLDQPWFLNTVLEVSFARRIDPHRFLADCLELEARFGRIRHTPKGARTLDIDLLLCRENGDFVVCDEIRDGIALTLPHPRLHLRRFVLEPLCELIPDERHPLLDRTFAELLSECLEHEVNLVSVP
jgi:2-amino-4-hydroxy-6-hydroxymethyldihydropteridine diphosphokinase